DSITEPKKILSCKEMCIFLSGKDEKGSIKNVEYHYSEADSRIRFVIIFVTYMLKLSWWLQSEFNKRGIKYTIISGLPS
ncbi:MAG: hypothetical protein KGI30_04045, partial [Planctomycetota bacterium]|nr:hypothetical protein [Planctomycetota bacterium]